MAKVGGVYNAIQVVGDACGDISCPDGERVPCPPAAPLSRTLWI